MNIGIEPDGTTQRLSLQWGGTTARFAATVASGRSGWRVHVKIAELTKQAEAALYLALSRYNSGRLALAIDDAEQLHHIVCASHDMAIDAIGNAVADYHERICPHFTRHPKAFEDAWAIQIMAAGQRREVGELVEYANEHLGQRYMIVKSDPDESLRIHDIGRGYVAFDQRWARMSAHTPLRDQPDLRYGAWLDDGYRQILADGTPRREIVDAVIAHPRRGHRRYAYRRLVLPFIDGAGGRYLFSTSVIEKAYGSRATE